MQEIPTAVPNDNQDIEITERFVSYPSLKLCSSSSPPTDETSDDSKDFFYCYFERMDDKKITTTKITRITVMTKPASWYVCEEHDVAFAWWFVAGAPKTHSGWTRIVNAFPKDIKQLYVLQKEESTHGSSNAFYCYVFADMDSMCNYVASVFQEFDRCGFCKLSAEKKKQEALKIVRDLRTTAKCEFGECMCDYSFAFYKLPIC